MKDFSRLVLGIFAFTLLVSFGWYMWDSTRTAPEPTFTQKLAEVLPQGEDGWTAEEEKLGSTEAVEEASAEILKFDDYVFRRYTKGNQQFLVYVAYWQPGKMPKRQINTHIPDVCWVNNGWKIDQKDNAHELDLGSLDAIPGQWRAMNFRGQGVEVIFWHVAGGEPVLYQNMGFSGKLRSIFTEPFESGFNLRQEQFFVRVHTGGDLDKLQRDPFFQKVMASLGATSVVHQPAS